jgi:uncharacterized DUF497 family protein
LWLQLTCDIEFDAAKEAENIAERGLSLRRYLDMSLDEAIVTDPVKHGELRHIVVGPIEGRVHVAVITARGDRVRIISLRKANRREQRQYAKARG